MPKNKKTKMTIAFLGTYPPRECGIATFTADLVDSFDNLFSLREETKVLAMNTEVLQTYNYPKKVIFQLSQNNPVDYEAAAEKLNSMPEVKVVSVQHEFGIYGNNYGSNLLIFLSKIKKPIVVTCHTVLPDPNNEIKAVVQNIASLADCLAVMTFASRDILIKEYGVKEEKIKFIPHGIHSLPYTDGLQAKASLRLSGKKVISTFGLLNRGKGIEYAIDALPDIVSRFPETMYLIIGATHPIVLKQEGEAYRNQLIERAYHLGVEKNILFCNRYLSTQELLKYLQASDVYLSLSQDPKQAVSGTLVYAMGAGRPIISTPFPQAKEIVTPETGELIEFGGSEGLAQKVNGIFADKGRLVSLGKAAYFRTRGMTWENVALCYMREFTRLSPELHRFEKSLPPFKLSHLNRLTDKFGLMQFAQLENPDPSWGYTLDDNARALAAVSLYRDFSVSKTALRLAKVYLSLIERAYDGASAFINYFNCGKKPDRELNSAENLDDANARAVWALAAAQATNWPREVRGKAERIFHKFLKNHKKTQSPRAAAFYLKALVWWLGNHRGDQQAEGFLTGYADYLEELFNTAASENWQWFEHSLTYSNAVLPEALLLAYRYTGNYSYYKIGKAALDFLVEHSFDGDTCIPVGQAGWFEKGKKKELHDQQPEEVSALVLALRTMFEITGEDNYRRKMAKVFDWFLGNNILNQVVYSYRSGGCYDGIGKNYINLNQGAESTVSYLLARLALEEKKAISQALMIEKMSDKVF